MFYHSSPAHCEGVKFRLHIFSSALWLMSQYPYFILEQESEINISVLFQFTLSLWAWIIKNFSRPKLATSASPPPVWISYPFKVWTKMQILTPCGCPLKGINAQTLLNYYSFFVPECLKWRMHVGGIMSACLISETTKKNCDET